MTIHGLAILSLATGQHLAKLTSVCNIALSLLKRKNLTKKKNI